MLREGEYFLPYNPSLVDRAREMRKNSTAAEKKLWSFLRTFPYRCWRQRPINHFIVDFYCPKLKLVIEVDGDSHFTEDGIASDLERTTILESYGLRVIRFRNDEVLRSFTQVCEQVSRFLPESP